jgi:hypothetical protein
VTTWIAGNGDGDNFSNFYMNHLSLTYQTDITITQSSGVVGINKYTINNNFQVPNFLPVPIPPFAEYLSGFYNNVEDLIQNPGAACDGCVIPPNLTPIFAIETGNPVTLKYAQYNPVSNSNDTIIVNVDGDANGANFVDNWADIRGGWKDGYVGAFYYDSVANRYNAYLYNASLTLVPNQNGNTIVYSLTPYP